MDQTEFIVAYCASFCEVEMTSDYDFYVDKSQSMKNQYEEALARFHKSWGDIVGWNNRFWGAVMASNAREAIDVLCEKMKKGE